MNFAVKCDFKKRSKIHTKSTFVEAVHVLYYANSIINIYPSLSHTHTIICSKHHFEPLPVVPLKVLAHNELVGRVIGKL